MINYKNNVVLKPFYLLYKKAVSNRYTIGVMEFEDRIVDVDCDNSTLKFHWIKDNHKRGWFADPFILTLTENEIIFLVEEYIYRLNRGVISKLVIDRNDYSIKNVKIILDTESHLSFPAYFRKNGKIYIYPESGQRGATYLYEYDEDTDGIKELYMINSNITADTILANLPDVQYGEVVQLCTTKPNFNNDILDVYPFIEDENVETLQPIARIFLNRMTARNAGFIFTVNGKMYRPAQDCSNYYGECVEIQEVQCKDGTVKFYPVNRIYSPNMDYSDAFHTFNVFENKLIAVDARRRRFPLFARLLGK